MTYYVYCGGAAEKAKPVIYLYPTKKQDVTVSVSPEGGVTESIPEMGKAWKVTAWPDGKIVEKNQDRNILTSSGKARITTLQSTFPRVLWLQHQSLRLSLSKNFPYSD